jgi:hypothetical protein
MKVEHITSMSAETGPALLGGLAELVTANQYA